MQDKGTTWNDGVNRGSPSDELAAQRRRRIRRAVVLVLIVLSSCVVWLGYQALVMARFSAFEDACKAARRDAAWPELERQARAWSQRQPDRTLPWAYAAEAAQRQGALARTAEYLRQVPDGDPRTPAALLELSDLLFLTLNRPLEGAEVCQRILRLDPKRDEAHRRLIFFYAMTLQRQAMIRQARTAIDNGSDTPETFIYLIGSDWLTFSNAYDLNTQWLEADPDSELFRVAQAIHYAGSSTAAESSVEDPAERMVATKVTQDRMLKDLLEQYPRNLELLAYFLGESCTAGDVDGVAKLLLQSPPEAVDDNRFWRFKGWLHAARGELLAAKTAYLRALDLHPFDWHSQHELAAVLRRLQQLDDVDAWEERAMAGKALRKIILLLPDVQSAPLSVMKQLAEYARNCGDHHVADCLVYRLKTTP